MVVICQMRVYKCAAANVTGVQHAVKAFERKLWNPTNCAYRGLTADMLGSGSGLPQFPGESLETFLMQLTKKDGREKFQPWSDTSHTEEIIVLLAPVPCKP